MPKPKCSGPEADSDPALASYRSARAQRRAGNVVHGLHHHAFFARDMEETRRFYQDVLGLPIVGTWVERHNSVTNQPDNYLHVFFELGDGSCPAFLQFKNKSYNDAIALNDFRNNNPFSHHIALSVNDQEALDEMKRRLKAAGIDYVDTDHGYCYSIYFFNPNGMQVELATNVHETEAMFAAAGAGNIPVETLHAWLEQDDLATNNTARPKTGWVQGR